MLVFPPAVPPATPINNGFFLISNFSGYHAVNLALSSLTSSIISIGFKN